MSELDDALTEMLDAPPEPGDAGDLLLDKGPGVEFEVKRFVLQALLEKAAGVVPSKEIMPVLKNFLIEATDSSLQVTATDLELSLVTATALVSVKRPGAIALPAKRLLEIVRLAEDADARVTVVDGACEIIIGRASWSLRLPSAAEYPPLPRLDQADALPVDRVAFLTALKAVRHAAARDSSRASLMMVRAVNGTLTACDGVRLMQAPLPLPPEFTEGLSIPSGAVDDLVRLLDGSDLSHVQVGLAEHHLVFQLGPDVFLANKLAAVFPDVEALLLTPARANTKEFRVSRDKLLDAVRRVRVNADSETAAIGLSLSAGSVVVQTNDKFGNMAAEPVDAEWAHEAQVLVLNHHFLTEMLTGHSGGQCTFRVGEDKKSRRSPLLLVDEGTGVVGVVQQMLSDWVQF